jgi:DNA-binding transcriptional MerR regulator
LDDKAPDAFRTISEVAEELDLPQHVLRFWESRFHEIKPMKRGGGRRYYRPSDIDLLRGIRHLLYGQGYTIRGVQRLLREAGIKFVQSVWLSGVTVPQDVAEHQGFADEFSAVEGAMAEPIANPDFDDLQDLGDDRREPQFNDAIRSGAPMATQGGMLALNDVHKLQTALKELLECRHLITTSLSDT